MSTDIPKSYGALLLGGLFASLLSGLVITQVVIYSKVYPRDTRRLKSLVLSILVLDISHTALIWTALWSYFVDNFGNEADIDLIHWSVALTIVITGFLTFFVHLFLANRIFLLSHRNYYLAVPIAFLAFLRLFSASVTTAEMLHLKTFSRFRAEFRWIFTTGLALSSSVDILITSSLSVLLHSSRTEHSSAGLNEVIDTLIQYTFESGSLTCAGTVVSLICWLSMDKNLIFLGLHFVISKLYANSLLVTLNTRDRVRRARSESAKEFSGMPVHLFKASPQSKHVVDDIDEMRHSESPTSSKGQIMLEVNVERTVIYETGI